MKISEVYLSFKGLNALYERALNDVKLVKANTDYTGEAKTKKVKEIGDKLINTYLDMLNKGIKLCDTGVMDKMEGNRICNIPKLTDEQKIYYLNYYTNIVEKLPFSEVIKFMEQQENINNPVYRDIWLLKADAYKNSGAELGFINFEKVDNITKTINGENLEGVAEYRELKLYLQNFANEIQGAFHFIHYNLENEDLRTLVSLNEPFMIQDGLNFYTYNR